MANHPQAAGPQALSATSTGPMVASGGDSPRAIMTTIDDLTALMGEEVRLLKAMQVREFTALQERKLALTKAYETQSQGLRENPARAASLSPRVRAEMRDRMTKLHAVMDDNAISILAAREMNHRVAQAIVAAVQEQKPENSFYSAAGALSPNKAAPPVSLQIDQSL